MSVQKLIYLFEKYKKSFVKEQRFVYQQAETPAPAQGTKEIKTEPKTPDQLRLEKEAADKAAKEAGGSKTQELGKNLGADLIKTPEKSELDKDLDSLDQSKFDKIMDSKVTGDITDGTLLQEQVSKLIVFAANNNPQKNLETFYKAIITNRISTKTQIDDNSIKILLNYLKDKKEKFDTMTEILGAEKVIKIEADDAEIINLIYDKIKNENRINGFDIDTLGILINKLNETNLKEFLSKISDVKKGECLKSKFATQESKQKIATDLIGTKSNFAEIETSAMNAIMVYLCTEYSGNLMEVIYGKFNQTTVQKLDLPAAKALLPILGSNPNTNEQTLYRYMLSDLQLPIKIAIVNDKAIDKKIRHDVFVNIPANSRFNDQGPPIDPNEQTDKATIPTTPKPEIKAEEKGEKTTAGQPAGTPPPVGTTKAAENKAETAPESTDINKLIEGTNLKFDGKTLNWTFDLTVKGEKVQSERNFRARDEFKEALAKVDHGTPEKVELFAYKWLLDKAYQGGKITKNKYHVKYFPESQAHLNDEITRLTELTAKQKEVKKKAPLANPVTPAKTEKVATPPITAGEKQQEVKGLKALPIEPPPAGTAETAGTTKAVTTPEEETAENKQFAVKEAEANKKILENSNHYLNDWFHLKDPTLQNAINNDELWNDLWEKRGTAKNKFIDGVEKITDLMGKLGVSEDKIKDETRELLQVGYNERLNFEEVFNRFIKGKSYPGSFDDLKNEKNSAVKNGILLPISQLLDSFEGLKVNVSKELDFNDQNETLLGQLESTKETPFVAGEYYDMESLVKGSATINKIDKAPDTTSLVTISTKAQEKFTNTLKELGKDGTKFTATDTLKLVFQLYGLDTLAAEKCLQKSPDGSNKFILTDLPKNFNKDNAQVKELFTNINAGSEIQNQKELIKKISETIDKNKAAIKMLLEVFSKDEGPLTYDLVPIDLLGISYLIRALDGEDRRELTLTMADIAAKKDTLMPDQFLQRYTSDKSAFVEILSKVTSIKDGVENYDQALLKTEFKNRADLGLAYILNDPQHFKELNEKLTKEYGDLNKPENLEKARAGLATKIDTFTLPLDDTVKQLIRVGHIIDGIVEQNEKEIKYSKNPKINKVEKQLAANGEIKTPEDIKAVEEFFGGGLMFPLNGKLGVDIFGVRDLKNGWKAGLAASVNKDGVNLGAGGSKSWELSKDGRVVATASLQASALTISFGGGASINFPISEKIDMNAGATAGLTAVGFYALGFIGIKENLNSAALDNFEKELNNQGFEKVESLIKSKASPEEIRKALFTVPVYGEQFKISQSKFKMSDQVLVEIYGKIRETINASTAEKSRTCLFRPVGAEVFAGAVNGVPVAGGYVEFAIGDKIMIVRTMAPGQENMKQASDEQIQALLLEKTGKKVETLKTQTKISESGHIVFDSKTNQIAILDSQFKSKFKGSEDTSTIAKPATLQSLNTELETANMGISKEPDSSLRLYVNNPKDAPGNIKILVDPLLQQQGISFSVDGNKILFKGIADEEIKNLRISREDFHYPFIKEGVQKFSIITIKTNKKRTRGQIEKESANIIYQSSGFEPEIRRGIGEGITPIIDKAQFKKEIQKPEETIEQTDMKDYEKYRGEMIKALNIQKKETFGEQARKGLIPEFTDYFSKKFAKEYRELSTEKTDEKTKYNPEALNKLIQDEAEKKGIKNLSSLELNLIHVELMHQSFMEAKDKQKVFKHNLDVCTKEVLIPFFEKTSKELGLKSSGQDMAEYIKTELAKTDIKNGTFEEFEKGTLFLSAVGTMKITGLRGTTFYGGDTLDLAHGILNFKGYSPASEGIEGDIGKTLLHILSPLEKDPAKNKEFMEAPLSLKLISQPGMYLILGKENSRKVLECFKTKTVTAENKEAFEKFRKIVLAVREAENKGEKVVKLENEYEIRIKTAIGMGTYKRCTNPTMAGNEEMEIWGTVTQRSGGETEKQVAFNREKVRLNYTTVRKAQTAILGVRLSFPKPEKPVVKPTVKPVAEKPKVQDSGETGGGTGGNPQGGAGQGLDTGHSGSTGGGTGGTAEGGAGQAQTATPGSDSGE